MPTINTMNEMHHQDNLEEEQNMKDFVHDEHEHTQLKLDDLQKKVDLILEQIKTQK